MTIKTLSAAEAIRTISHRLVAASQRQVDDVRTILERGAGLLPLPPGAVPDNPEGLVPDRREIWITLADVVRIKTVGASEEYNPHALWTPVRVGDWESVLATLIIEGEWAKIAEVAAELREGQS